MNDLRELQFLKVSAKIRSIFDVSFISTDLRFTQPENAPSSMLTGLFSVTFSSTRQLRNAFLEIETSASMVIDRI